MEATTNLIGGQPFSMANLKEVRKIAAPHGIPVIMDCSLISENAYFIKRREPGYADVSIENIVREMMSQTDLIYLSGRKSTCVRGGLIATNNPAYFEQLKAWLPVYEGFITYGGMSSKEIEAMAVGLREMVDYDVASSSADLIAYFVDEMVKLKYPRRDPAGRIGRPRRRHEVPAARAAVRIYGRIAGGRPVPDLRRAKHGARHHFDGPRPAGQRRLFRRRALPHGRSAARYSVSHIDYVVDRLAWLHEHRKLVGGLKFHQEPPVLRFFTGKLKALNNWGAKLAEAFQADFGPNS